MLYGLPQAAGKIALSLAGVTVLAAGANTVAIVAEAVRRAVVESYGLVTGAQREITSKSTKSSWNFVDFTPYSSTKNWQALGFAALKNIVVGTAALYIANRFYPNLVTSANWLLHNVVGIQFTPAHIPLTKLVGL